MSTEIVVCPQCGKKYKVQEGASGSFPCKECGAAVKIGGAASPSPTRRSRAGAAPERKARGGKAPTRGGGGRATARRSARAAPARGRRSRAPDEESVEETRTSARGRRRPPPKNNNAMIFGVLGLVVVAVVLFVVMSGGKDDPNTGGTTTASTGGQNPGGTTAKTDGDAGTRVKDPVKPDGGTDADKTDGASDPKKTDGDNDPKKADGGADPKKTDEGTDPKKADGTEEKPRRRLKGSRKGKKNPYGFRGTPSEIPHMEGVADDVKKKVDDLIKVLIDPDAGADSSEASTQLEAIGLPAYPRLIEALAKIRDRMPANREALTGDAEIAANALAMSARWCDSTLRKLDGHLDAQQKYRTINMAASKEYIRDVVWLHHKRWTEDVKGKMDKAPGPFDPASLYDDEEEDE